MQARYYDPVLGRFLSNDPVAFTPDEPQMFGRYTYVKNDPINMIDPDGKFGLGLAAKALKVAIKGGDLAATFAGAAQDLGTLTSANASLGDKLGAAISLASEVASPVSLRDAKAGAKAVSKLTKQCFVAGTLVLTEDGRRPIEEIAVGDLVWAADPETGVEGWRKVLNTIANDASSIWEVSLDDPAAGQTRIHRVTPEHPYWVANAANDNGEETGAWVEVKDLKPGMKLTTTSDNVLTVIAANDTGDTAPTFNFEVDDLHTYFVGEEEVLVHNNDCVKGAKGGDRAGKNHTRAAVRDEKAANATQNGGVAKCVTCGGDTTPTTKRTKGSTVAPTEAQGAHVISKANGGDGATVKDRSNVAIQCASCNNKTKTNDVEFD